MNSLRITLRLSVPLRYGFGYGLRQGQYQGQYQGNEIGFNLQPMRSFLRLNSQFSVEGIMVRERDGVA